MGPLSPHEPICWHMGSAVYARAVQNTLSPSKSAGTKLQHTGRYSPNSTCIARFAMSFRFIMVYYSSRAERYMWNTGRAVHVAAREREHGQ